MENKMNIDELTLGQVKELQNLFNSPTIKSNLYDRYKGKYVICRTGNEGVNAGVVVDLDETGVILKDARRLYYHKPVNKDVSWYEGVATYGISTDSHVGTAVEKVIIENYSLTICTELAEKSIKDIAIYGQN